MADPADPAGSTPTPDGYAVGGIVRGETPTVLADPHEHFKPTDPAYRQRSLELWQEATALLCPNPGGHVS